VLLLSTLLASTSDVPSVVFVQAANEKTIIRARTTARIFLSFIEKTSTIFPHTQLDFYVCATKFTKNSYSVINKL
jgi:hypothetical protein